MEAPELSDFEAVCEYVKDTVQAGLWRMVVVPRQIPKEKGGVMIDDESREAELYNTPVGKVVSVGKLAFKAHTKAHLNLAEDPNVPVEGDWILFHANASRRTELRAKGDERVICFVLQDTDFLCRVSDPDRIMAYLS